ncbi:uncharacterized protein PG986_000058 [Apiospora aurea]|uniref:Uncharacterized protein n=1 Tax=Apiospora aurea TaxID=335848 RepID=A0ABR1QSW9_9PEZI
MPRSRVSHSDIQRESLVSTRTDSTEPKAKCLYHTVIQRFYHGYFYYATPKVHRETETTAATTTDDDDNNDEEGHWLLRQRKAASRG